MCARVETICCQKRKELKIFQIEWLPKLSCSTNSSGWF
jgi:hypothetical protein